MVGCRGLLERYHFWDSMSKWRLELQDQPYDCGVLVNECMKTIPMFFGSHMAEKVGCVE